MTHFDDIFVIFVAKLCKVMYCIATPKFFGITNFPRNIIANFCVVFFIFCRSFSNTTESRFSSPSFQSYLVAHPEIRNENQLFESWKKRIKPSE